MRVLCFPIHFTAEGALWTFLCLFLLLVTFDECVTLHQPRALYVAVKSLSSLTWKDNVCMVGRVEGMRKDKDDVVS